MIRVASLPSQHREAINEQAIIVIAGASELPVRVVFFP